MSAVAVCTRVDGSKIEAFINISEAETETQAKLCLDKMMSDAGAFSVSVGFRL